MTHSRGAGVNTDGTPAPQPAGGEVEGEEEGEEEGGEEGEGEEGEGEEEDDEVQSFLLFSSENWRWPTWLPRLHLELIRRRTRTPAQTADDTAAELAQLRELFPNTSDGSLRRTLLSSPSLEAAIEQLLDGFEQL